MWLIFGLAGIGYYLWSRETMVRTPDGNDSIRVVDGAQTFTPEQKVAILSALPMLAMEQVDEVDGAKTYRLVPSSTTGPNAGLQVTKAIEQGQVVGASISLLSTVVEDHYVAIAFPARRSAVAQPGSPLALLHDPKNPGL